MNAMVEQPHLLVTRGSCSVFSGASTGCGAHGSAASPRSVQAGRPVYLSVLRARVCFRRCLSTCRGGWNQLGRQPLFPLGAPVAEKR
jgi:hypothetical protein